MNHLHLIAIAGFLACAWFAPALADPCDGAVPARGTAFAGVVRYVGDGDGASVGPAGRPDRWIEVRLADFYAPELHEAGGREAKRRLERLVLGKPLVCSTSSGSRTGQSDGIARSKLRKGEHTIEVTHAVVAHLR